MDDVVKKLNGRGRGEKLCLGNQWFVVSMGNGFVVVTNDKLVS